MNQQQNINGCSHDVEAAILNALEALPETPPDYKKSSREMIHELAPKIRARLNNGYTYPQIAKILSNAGLNLTVGTLKTYLSTAPKGFSDKNPTKRRSHKNPPTEQKDQKGHSNVEVPTNAANNGNSMSRPAFQDPDEK